MVSLYMCLKEAHLLVAGKPPRVPGDEIAAADGPYDADALIVLRDRVKNFRNEILHLSDKSEEGREVHVSWTADPPHFAIRSTIGERGKLESDTITRTEIEAILADFDPWLRRHWDRLVHEEPADPDVLAAMIETTMRKLGGADADQEDAVEVLG